MLGKHFWRPLQSRLTDYKLCESRGTMVPWAVPPWPHNPDHTVPSGTVPESLPPTYRKSGPAQKTPSTEPSHMPSFLLQAARSTLFYPYIIMSSSWCVSYPMSSFQKQPTRQGSRYYVPSILRPQWWILLSAFYKGQNHSEERSSTCPKSHSWGKGSI